MNEKFFGSFRTIAALELPRTSMTPPFEGVLGECYSAVVGADAHDLQWALDRLGSYPGTVLDLCCGGGRFLTEAVSAGHTVTGVDISQDMLHAATRRMASTDLGIQSRARLLAGDALTLDLEETFDYVILGGLTITLFGTEERAALLRTAARHLKPGGQLLLDYSPVEDPQEDHTGHFTVPVAIGDQRGFYDVGWSWRPNVRQSVTNTYCELVDRHGVTDRYLSAFSFKLFTGAEMSAELQVVGFEIAQVSDVDQKPSSPDVVHDLPPLNLWLAAELTAA
ncbi:class I SAM-dependent methyltransferase [Streptomyces aurantiacus]|uniref:Methyltransferase domain-containing protein n=1 Tax=Streptomyces aurantiacus TaxID=47760 RepID=A0A7G1PBN1_9ACTN|nr:class I SAM-dependent methyltransferase [Streptomyces aurantiacus]BCL30475.1 hypothetical protein GCM10017557_53340 [Streptomyces aurantiacus]